MYASPLRVPPIGSASPPGRVLETWANDIRLRCWEETPGRCSRVSHFRNARVPTRRLLAVEQLLRRCEIVSRNKKVNGAAGAVPRVGVRRWMRSGAGHKQCLRNALQTECGIRYKTRASSPISSRKARQTRQCLGWVSCRLPGLGVPLALPCGSQKAFGFGLLKWAPSILKVRCSAPARFTRVSARPPSCAPPEVPFS